MDRRRFLVTGAAVALAGCAGGDGNADGDGTGGADGGTERGPLGGHAAATGLASQPTLGPDPTDATGVIVAFEDPSCPRCRTFEQEVVPEIREKLIDPGHVSLVQRGYPVVYDWGEPAAHALEATYAAEPAAVWDLWAHYFAEQSAYHDAGPAEVYPRTRSFLAAETDLDAAQVVDAAENGEYDDAVQTDLDAGAGAGAGGTTPTLFLFRDGEYLTKAAGSVSYQVVAETLQL